MITKHDVYAPKRHVIKHKTKHFTVTVNDKMQMAYEESAKQMKP